MFEKAEGMAEIVSLGKSQHEVLSECVCVCVYVWGCGWGLTEEPGWDLRETAVSMFPESQSSRIRFQLWERGRLQGDGSLSTVTQKRSRDDAPLGKARSRGTRTRVDLLNSAYFHSDESTQSCDKAAGELAGSWARAELGSLNMQFPVWHFVEEGLPVLTEGAVWFFYQWSIEFINSWNNQSAGWIMKTRSFPDERNVLYVI